MLFNSYEFIFIFLPITFFIYFYLLEKRLIIGAKTFLVFSSLFFYSWWNIIYLPLILGSILFNYAIGSKLIKSFDNKNRSKKYFLIVGIMLNLLLLGYFKYSDFFISNYNLLTDSSVELFHFILPLGISFFTFTQIAYLVDSYRGEAQEYRLMNYGLFVTFFPHLLAGPILHHKEMMPQFDKAANLVKNYRNIAVGSFLFSIGLFKKVAIADTFSVWATNGFNAVNTLNMIEAWITSLSYTFQLYFDFSGYTDMAIGIALLFNIKLPLNFNSPYKATNIQDFWRRWHITLSRFLKDYIYIPLGGNKQGSYKTYSNLMITFLLGGLWHGAGWTFIFWGFLHGIALVIHRVWSALGLKISNWAAWFITFNFINISWVFFRADEWNDAIGLLNTMFFGPLILPYQVQSKFSFLSELGFTFGDSLSAVGGSKYTIVLLLLTFVILFLKNSQETVKRLKPSWYYMLFTAFLFGISILTLHNTSEFLYFNF